MDKLKTEQELGEESNKDYKLYYKLYIEALHCICLPAVGYCISGIK